MNKSFTAFKYKTVEVLFLVLLFLILLTVYGLKQAILNMVYYWVKVYNEYFIIVYKVLYLLIILFIL